MVKVIIKVLMMLGYVLFSAVCMVIACLLKAEQAFITIFVVWLTSSILIFALILKYMNYEIYKGKEMVEDYMNSGKEPEIADDLENSLSVLFERYDLTKRELEILDQLCHGKTNTQIADTLYISESTVKTHISHAYRKLGVKNRTEAVCLVKNQMNSGIPVC